MTAYCKGNLALFSEGGSRLHLVVEPTGSFPLYYARRSSGLLFSSHLRPLAKAIGADPDPAGLYQYVVRGYIVGERTEFKGV